MQKIKYPRTYHLPFSEGYTSDDKVLENDDMFKNKEVVVSIKMDGENTTIYPNGDYHARSLDSKHKDYHSWLLSYIPSFSYLIPKDIRICGEYLYAKHSIFYNELPSYFEMFSAWRGNYCLPWSETYELAKILGIFTVPIVYEGIYNTEKIKKIAKMVTEDGQEGIVVRLKDGFYMEDFKNSVAKYVRKNHVQTDDHWSQQIIQKNCLPD